MAKDENDLRATISEALEGGETARQEPATPVEQDTKRDAGRNRDDVGKFAARDDDEQPDKPAKEPKPEKAPKAAADPDKPISDPSSETNTQEPAAPSFLPPGSWSGPAKEKFATLDPTVQTEIIKRERDISRLVHKSTEESKPYQEIGKVLEPFRQKFQASGVTDGQAISQLLGFYQMLEADPVQGLQTIARRYGVNPQQLTASYQPEQPIDPRFQQIQQTAADASRRVAAFEQQQKAAAETAASQHVQAFMATHPHVEDLESDMSMLMVQGRATDLESSYNLALNLNPDVAIRIQNEKRAKAANQAVQAGTVKKERTSVNGSPAPGGALADSDSSLSLRDQIASALNGGGRL